MNRDQYIEAFRELNPDAQFIVKGNTWKDVEIPGFDKPDEATLVAAYTEKVRGEKLAELKENYLSVCHETDNDYLKELKRKEVGIAKSKDTIDKNKALTRYHDATLLYEEKKMFIERCKSIEDLEQVTLEVEGEVAVQSDTETTRA